MHAVTASGLDCPFSHPKRLGIPHVGERGQSISEAFRSHSSGIKPIRDTVAAAAARRRKQFSSKTGQSLIFPKRLETSARSRVAAKRPLRLPRASTVDRWARDRAAAGWTVGSGVVPARIGREAGIWDRDSLLAS